MSERCPDCGCKEGELHDYGCDIERCPFSGSQLNTYKVCLSKNTRYVKEKKSGKRKHRIPYIYIPRLCALCGVISPWYFETQWKKYVIPPLQKEDLCRKCYNQQKKLFPDGWKKAKQCLT